MRKTDFRDAENLAPNHTVSAGSTAGWGVSSHGSPAARHPASSEEANIASPRAALLGLHPSFFRGEASLTRHNLSLKPTHRGGGCRHPQLRTCTRPGRARGIFAGLMRARVLFTVAAAVRGVMAGVREAATLAVYRQIAVLFRAAQASLGGSETQQCGSFPSRKSPEWPVM